MTFWWLLLLGPPAAATAPAPPAPRGFADEVTVTASGRSEAVADTPSAVAVLTARELEATAAPTIDDALRQAPGFQLFRRSGSRTANPTAQGVTLRGLGGSGASRAAVLDDGFPVNDAFGGWVQWSRVPLAAVERVEVLRGGGSSLYGTGSLAGVVQIVRRGGAESRLDLDAWAGSLGSRQGSLFASGTWRAWRARAAAEAFTTGGYIPVRASERGPVDSPASSRHLSADLTVERSAGAQGRAFVRGAYFDESRGNGTPLQRNDTALWQVAAGLDHLLGGGSLSARGHAGGQVYQQDFSAIDAGRQAERLTRRQRVPAHAGGALVQWARPRGTHALLAGLEAREVGGSSEEEIVSGAGLTRVVAEGRQRSAAAYLQDVWAVSPRWVVTAGARWDGWRNLDRSESALSPRLAARYQAARGLALSGSAYGAFRAPTLNELYRSFRVGNVLTEADPSLRAERLRGVEAAALMAPAFPLSARLTAFWMEVDDTIANVTLSSTPALVTRQRRNLGRILSRGAELEVETRPAAPWVLSGSWMVADATVLAFPETPALEGRRLAQVPRHQVAVQGRFDGQRVRVSAQARWSSRQFEDDLNSLELGPARNLDLRAAWRAAPRLEAYLALENALDSEQEVGRTPVVTLAPPRTLRAGLRLHVGRDPGTSVAHR